MYEKYYTEIRRAVNIKSFLDTVLTRFLVCTSHLRLYALETKKKKLDLEICLLSWYKPEYIYSFVRLSQTAAVIIPVRIVTGTSYAYKYKNFVPLSYQTPAAKNIPELWTSLN